MDTFDKLLSARLTELGLTQPDLAKYLTEKGIETTKQSVNGWCTGATRPQRWKRDAIYDFLGLRQRERSQWTEALLARKDPNPDDVPTVVTE